MVTAKNLGRAVGYVHITHFLVKHESWELQVTVHSAIVSLQGQQFPKFGNCLQMAPHEQGIHGSQSWCHDAIHHDPPPLHAYLGKILYP